MALTLAYSFTLHAVRIAWGDHAVTLRVTRQSPFVLLRALGLPLALRRQLRTAWPAILTQIETLRSTEVHHALAAL